jgi:hypothetical protein
MLTYGLVKQRGPYARDYPSSYKQSNEEIISPRYPFDASAASSDAYHNRSLWAARLVPDSANLEAPKFKMDVLKQRQKEMELKVNLSLMFGNSFGVEGAVDEGQPLGGVPGDRMPNEAPEEPVKEEEVKQEEDVIEPGQDFYPITAAELAPVVQTATEALGSLFDRFQITRENMQPYMNVMLPIVSHFVSTGALAVEGGIELLLGDRVGGFLINLLRQDERLRREFTTMISDYAVRPAARLVGQQVRNFLYDPSNFIQLTFGRGERGQPPPPLPITFPDGAVVPTPTTYIPTSTIGSVGEGVAVGVGNTLGEIGRDIAAQTIQQNAPSIVRMLLGYLAGPGANPTDINRLANAFAGPVTIVNNRVLRYRGPDGRVVNVERLLRRVFGRRAALG